LWVSDNEVQTRWRKYFLVYLLITYVLKDKPKNKDITVIPFKKWITEQHRRERLKVAPHAKARGIQNGIPRWLTGELLAIEGLDKSGHAGYVSKYR
jgi:hypothetical protein